MTSTHRLTRAMKLRRVMREGGGSEIRADGESPGETTEECARLLGSEGGRARVAGYLLISLRATYCWDAVARTHTVERSESIGIGRNVVVNRARRASEGIVPHVCLEGPNWCRDSHADSRSPLEAVQPQRRRLVLIPTHDLSALPYVAGIRKERVLNELREHRTP